MGHRSSGEVGCRWLRAIVVVVFLFAGGPGAATPLWLADGSARIGLDPATDSGVFAWGAGSSAIESQLWWWVQVGTGPVESFDGLPLEVNRKGDDRVELEAEIDALEAEFELELGVSVGDGASPDMTLLQEFEVENEGGELMALRLLLLSDFDVGVPHPIVFPSGDGSSPAVVEWIGGIRFETSFSRAPDQVAVGSPTALLSDFGVASGESDSDADEAPGWAAEWWFELQPFDEIEFAVQTRSVPEPSVSLLFVLGLGVMGRCRHAERRPRA